MLPNLFTLSPDASGRRAPFLSALVIPSGARNLHSVPVSVTFVRLEFSSLQLRDSSLQFFPVTIPRGSHPFPSRTR